MIMHQEIAVQSCTYDKEKIEEQRRQFGLQQLVRSTGFAAATY